MSGQARRIISTWLAAGAGVGLDGAAVSSGPWAGAGAAPVRSWAWDRPSGSGRPSGSARLPASGRRVSPERAPTSAGSGRPGCGACCGRSDPVAPAAASPSGASATDCGAGGVQRSGGAVDAVGAGSSGRRMAARASAAPVRVPEPSAFSADPPPSAAGVPDRAGVVVPSGAPSSTGAAPPSSRRRSRASRRAARPRCVSSEAGSSRRAMSSSRCRRGLVAPTMSVSARLVMSARRESSARESCAACADRRRTWSSGMPCRIAPASSGRARAITRSRKRSSRSSTKRRGSWPDCTTRSTTRNTVGVSSAATASITSSSRASGVKPSRLTASS